MLLHKFNTFIYLVFDFMTDLEYGNILPKETFYFKESIFSKIQKSGMEPKTITEVISSNLEEITKNELQKL